MIPGYGYSDDSLREDGKGNGDGNGRGGYLVTVAVVSVVEMVS